MTDLEFYNKVLELTEDQELIDYCNKKVKYLNLHESYVVSLQERSEIIYNIMREMEQDTILLEDIKRVIDENENIEQKITTSNIETALRFLKRMDKIIEVSEDFVKPPTEYRIVEEKEDNKDEAQVQS